jgi:hypothetical protein
VFFWHFVDAKKGIKMGMFRWLVGGLVGALIGGAVWVAVGYFANYEVGWIAWAIGFVVGLGVRVGAGEDDGFAPGILAVVIAVLAIAASKYLVISMSVNREFGETTFALEADAEMMTSQIADEIVAEYEAKGKTIKWPKAAEDEDAPLAATYPSAIWKEATKRWEAIPPEEQQAQMEKAEAEFNELVGEIMEAGKSDVKASAFQESFSPYDILWFILAAFTAFKLGSGLTSDE